MASATNKKPLEFPRKATDPKSNASEPRRKDFLFYLANGHSIEQAYTLVGVTRKGYENWRRRHKEFPKLVEAARESHRRDIDCGFHGADAYARMLLDAIQRDESLPAPLRYRASKTILTRKGKTDWLPDSIPADTEPLALNDDEQPDSFKNGFPSEPAHSKFESAESATDSHRQEQSESASAANLSPEAGSRKPGERQRAPSIPSPPQPQHPLLTHCKINAIRSPNPSRQRRIFLPIPSLHPQLNPRTARQHHVTYRRNPEARSRKPGERQRAPSNPFTSPSTRSQDSIT